MTRTRSHHTASLPASGQESRAAWIGPYADYPREACFSAIFEEQVRLAPESPAVSLLAEQLTYAELDRRANHLAHHLRSQGVRTDSIVAIHLERGLDLVVSLLAVLKSGGAYLPFDASSPPRRVEELIRDSGAVALITSRGLTDSLQVDVRRVFLDELTSSNGSPGSDAELPRGKPDDLAYVLYTSGSTGRPKGVMIPHRGLVNYLCWARDYYRVSEGNGAPVHSPVGFDLTITSLLLPLVSGTEVVLVPEDAGTGSLADALRARDDFSLVKLTPSHLSLLERLLPTDALPGRANALVIGGEALFGEQIARWREHAPETRLINEYGPTETVVGCMVYEVPPGPAPSGAIPIGLPIANTQIYLLDEEGQPVPEGEAGEIHVGGDGLARGYLGDDELTAERFIPNSFGEEGSRLYRTGDLGRQLPDGNLVYTGRIDNQLKLRGHRIEPGEIEVALLDHPQVQQVAVTAPVLERTRKKSESVQCSQCFLTSNIPGVLLDASGVCNHCSDYTEHRYELDKYFGDEQDLLKVVESARSTSSSEYDCLLLYSGGKDSTYVLYRLIDLGLRVLTFTFNNGFISPTALENIQRTCAELGVKNITVTTPNMNEVFAESLRQDSAVCSGCFRGINSFSTKLAMQKRIPVCVNGLSRGQIYEMRLEPYIRSGKFRIEEIEADLDARRKIYHGRQDRIGQLLHDNVLEDQSAFEDVHHVDYFRYSNASKKEIFAYLLERSETWRNPQDTGFCSSNCMINDVGIKIHGEDTGYHYYASSTSWEVRLGHISYEAGLEELQEVSESDGIDEVLRTIGYERMATPGEERTLVAHVVVEGETSVTALRDHLSERLPEYMLPQRFVFTHSIPLTDRGKVDLDALPDPDRARPPLSVTYTAPRTEDEQAMAKIWSTLLSVDRIGVHDNFFDLGGDSLAAASFVTQMESDLGRTLALSALATHNTIEELVRMLDAGESDEQETIRALNRGGTLRPFFCVSALGVLLFEPLARHMGKDQPFYGCHIPGYERGADPLNSVEEIAATHIKGLRAIQPEGPYQIGGQCFGGTVAFEMAQQLIRDGKEVSLLVLFDGRRPVHYGPLRKRFLTHPQGRRLRWHYEALWGRSLTQKAGFILGKLGGLRSKAGSVSRNVYYGADEVTGENDARFVHANEVAELSYVAEPYQGRIVHFIQTEPPILSPRDRRTRWTELAEEGMELHTLPGKHLDMFREPWCRALADKLAPYLETRP